MIKLFFERLGLAWTWHRKVVSWRGMHSPFLFGLGEAWYRTGGRSREGHRPDVEALRRAWSRDATGWTMEEWGSGSVRAGGGAAEAESGGEGGGRRVAVRVRDRIRWSTAPARQARELAALARWIRAEHVLELGTNLGLTTAYLAGDGRRVLTVEGDARLAGWAAAGWRQTDSEGRIEGVVARFEEVVPGWCAARGGSGSAGTGAEPWDLVFVDGDHRSEAVHRWVDAVAPALRANRGGDRPSAVVVDDIRWNADMWAAWNRLAAEDRWDFVIDRGAYGVLVRHPGVRHPTVRVALGDGIRWDRFC